MMYVCERRELKQVLAVADLHDVATPALLEEMIGMVGGRCHAVYSDPPWNPGNEKYWRNHANAPRTPGYDAFLDAWCAAAGVAIRCGATDVLCEQSANEAHWGLMVAAAGRAAWPRALPLLEWWEVQYGGSSSARPNTLLHFGGKPLSVSPWGMSGEAMTIRACAGLHLPAGAVLMDPCIGQGMTSRVAHYFGWNCVGTELNPARLQKTVEWLKRQGYRVERHAR
ncbi:MAG TPA: hypothetical protein VF158_15945 [Longimicrobiales bacterium]